MNKVVENMMKNYVLVEYIKGNKDLHKIAKKVGLEDGGSYLPRNTTRKQFMNEITMHINWQLEMTDPPVRKSVLTEELQKIIKIAEKEEKKKERSR